MALVCRLAFTHSTYKNLCQWVYLKLHLHQLHYKAASGLRQSLRSSVVFLDQAPYYWWPRWVLRGDWDPFWLRPWRVCLQCRRPRLDSWVRKIPLEREIATLSSILAWRIPQIEEPGRLRSTESQRVGHDGVTFTFKTHSTTLRGAP